MTRPDMQIDKVDVNYFKSTQRLSIEEETKIKGTKEEADAYFAKSSDAMEGTPLPLYN
jgi:ubiquitin conjugation factor E4 B